MTLDLTLHSPPKSRNSRAVCDSVMRVEKSELFLKASAEPEGEGFFPPLNRKKFISKVVLVVSSVECVNCYISDHLYWGHVSAIDQLELTGAAR